MVRQQVHTFIQVAIMMLAASSPGCQNQHETVDQSRYFVLDDQTKDAAPRMQEQLVALTRYAGPNYEVKYNFVFIDETKTTQGRLDTSVARYTFMHFTYYLNDHIRWNGSIIFEPSRGIALSSIRGYDIDIVVKDQSYQVAFKGNESYSAELPRYESQALWVKGDKGKLYVHHFLFPDTIRESQKNKSADRKP